MARTRILTGKQIKALDEGTTVTEHQTKARNLALEGIARFRDPAHYSLPL